MPKGFRLCFGPCGQLKQIDQIQNRRNKCATCLAQHNERKIILNANVDKWREKMRLGNTHAHFEECEAIEVDSEDLECRNLLRNGDATESTVCNGEPPVKRPRLSND